MLKFNRPFIFLGAFFVLALGVARQVNAQTLPATITVNAASTITSFAPLSIFGNNTAYWISQANNYAVSTLVEQSGDYFLRYPGGSSSDDYHWNGSGSFDANHHWVPSGTTYSTGFEGYETYCGTTGSNNATTHPYSHLVDGSTATTWLSNVDTNFPNHQFAYLDLTRANSTVNVTAVSIIWGTPYATSYEVQYWTGASNANPYKAANETSWVDFAGGNLTGASGGTTVITFTTPEATRFVRVLMTASSAGAGGAYAIAEIYVFNGATQVSTNTANYQTQSLAVVSSTDPACTNHNFPSFEFASFMTYLHSFTPAAVPLITVNVGTGTPSEAASWVYYANTIKGYGIKYWQVGNEMDGIWETAGPFRADDYAYRFTEYYNAMTAVDPTIILTGPVVGGPNNNSDAYDGLTYIQTFLNTLQTLGATADLGALDYHWYAGSTTAAAALGTPAQISTFATNLSNWMASAGVSPTLPVLMSEYNVNAGTPLLMNQLPTGLWLVNWLGEFIHYFGPGGHTNLWDTMNGSTDTTNNTTGDQGYLQVEAGAYQYQPRVNYWAMQMMATDWAIPGDSSTHQLVSATSSAATLVSYADYRPDGVLSLIVVNKDPTNSYATNLNIGPFIPNSTANTWSFDATNYAWETTSSPYHASPDTAPTTTLLSGVSSSFPVTFTPYSINVFQFTDSGVPTHTVTPTMTPTFTLTSTATKTPTNSPTASSTKTSTFTPTDSLTPTITATPTLSPTFTFTGTPTDTPTVTSTLTPTTSATETSSLTFTLTPSDTPTLSPTNTSCMDGFGNTCTYTPTIIYTDTLTATFTNTWTWTVTPSYTSTWTSTPTVTSTNTTVNSPTWTATITDTSTSSPTNTLSPTPTQTVLITSTPGVTGIYPNPVQDGSPIHVGYLLNLGARQVKLKIFTLALRKIYEDDNLSTAAGGQVYTLDGSRLGNTANGVYYVVIYFNYGGQVTYQVMKMLVVK